MEESSAKGKATITREELMSPNVAFILGNKIAELEIKVDKKLLYPVPSNFKSRNQSEGRRTKPHAFRLSQSVMAALDEAVETLGLLHRTDFVEAAILSACIRLGFSVNRETQAS